MSSSSSSPLPNVAEKVLILGPSPPAPRVVSSSRALTASLLLSHFFGHFGRLHFSDTGCGVFGVSTALHFLQAGYKDIQIIDKVSSLSPSRHDFRLFGQLRFSHFASLLRLYRDLEAHLGHCRIGSQSDVLPAVDAASPDLNKIIRAGDYADPELARLSVEAVQEWKKDIWEGCYHESGMYPSCLTSHLALLDSLIKVYLPHLFRLPSSVFRPFPRSMIRHPPHS
jgi:hypothetical protein